MAGENNGLGIQTGAPTHANSICAFSGLNDTPSDIFGKIQSWGWTMRVLDLVARYFNPGDACRGGFQHSRMMESGRCSNRGSPGSARPTPIAL